MREGEVRKRERGRKRGVGGARRGRRGETPLDTWRRRGECSIRLGIKGEALGDGGRDGGEKESKRERERTQRKD